MSKEIDSKLLSDQYWRLNNLYKILDKDGRRITFKMNRAQERFFHDMHYRNVILKARQLGFSTFIDLYILDTCLFRPGIEAAIIADTQNNAEEIFRRKIMYPYEHLPSDLRQAIPPKTGTKGSAGQLQLANESIMNVTVSARSSTAQIIHSSELAKMAATHPDKADEFVSGTLGAASSNRAMIFMESTARGNRGVFFDYCQTAMRTDREVEEGSRVRSNLDWKFHFFPWWEEPEYILPGPINTPSEVINYFNRLKADHNIDLTAEQRNWYAMMWIERGEERMRSEYPSYPDEAFEQSIEGSYFAKQMQKLRTLGQVTDVPYDSRLMVDTWWDIGMNDTTCIWFTQSVGREVRIIDFYENKDEGLEHYRDVLQGKGYVYDKHVGPHDLEVREFGTGSSRYQAALQLGIKFTVIPRPGSKMDSIQAVRGILPICWFDKKKCADGIVHLELYSKQLDAKRGVYRNTPKHDEHSHAADAFQTFARGHSFVEKLGNQMAVPVGRSSFSW